MTWKEAIFRNVYHAALSGGMTEPQAYAFAESYMLERIECHT